MDRSASASAFASASIFRFRTSADSRASAIAAAASRLARVSNSLSACSIATPFFRVVVSVTNERSEREVTDVVVSCETRALRAVVFVSVADETVGETVLLLLLRQKLRKAEGARGAHRRVPVLPLPVPLRLGR